VLRRGDLFVRLARAEPQTCEGEQGDKRGHRNNCDGKERRSEVEVEVEERYGEEGEEEEKD
jgi:hypothetical protein